MDRPTLRTTQPTTPSPSARRPLPPLDVEVDDGDESIYGLSYRARVGAVVTDRAALDADLTAVEAAVVEAVAAETPAVKVGRS
jgi:hypothetical protein